MVLFPCERERRPKKNIALDRTGGGEEETEERAERSHLGRRT
jgi:hypothetical protein